MFSWMLVEEVGKVMTAVKEKIGAFNNHVNRSRTPSPVSHCRTPSPRRHSPVMMADSYDIPTPIPNIGCQELLENTCTHCGWLRKKRLTLKLFSWPQAYVVLYDGCLYYFKHERGKAASGNFSLYGYNAVYRATEIPIKEAQWSLKIVHSHREFKTYYFSASSEQEMKIWMSNIKKEMLHANGRSAIYGKNLQFVREEEKTDEEQLLDDPSFYQQIEENIYDDSCKFIPSKDYQKKCSIKKENEDSDDEDLPDTTRLNDRRPLQTPTHEPFITIIPANRHTGISQTNSTPLDIQPPSKPPRVPDFTPPTPPRSHRNPPPIPPSKSDPAFPQDRNEDARMTPNIVQMLQQKFSQENTVSHLTAPRKNPPQTRVKRRGSYEKTEGPGSKSPSLTRRPMGQDQTHNGSSGGGGSTGSEDMSDAEEDWSNFYYDVQDKQKASDIIQAIGDDGVFLVRPENAGNGKVLVVFAFDQCKKYRIKHQDGVYFLAKEGHHDASLENLLKHYMENDLPTVNVKLRQPFKLHPSYKSINID